MPHPAKLPKALFAVLALISLCLLSSPSPLTKEELFSRGKDSLELYLDRADRESNPEDWLRYAAMGKDEALARWEGAALLALGADELGAARDALEGSLSGLSADRYREWLVERFSSSLEGESFASLRAAIKGQNDSLLFSYDPRDGSLLRDSYGDPLLKALAGLGEDRATWETKVGEAIDASVAAWRSSFEGAFPELLSQVPESERGALDASAASCADAYAASYRRELEALSLQEERRFVAMRSYDQYSLRKKSEEATAGEVADRLIAESQDATDEGIRRLRASLASDSGGSPGEASIDASAWQASFQRVLETGLATWDKAGERLLAERVEWERDAGKSYVDGEKAWASAYERLRAGQSEWQAELRGLLETGEAAWADKEAELELAIERASSELDREIAQRESAKSDQVTSLVEVYSQSASMVATARESSAYWIKRMLGREAPDGTAASAILGEWGGSRLDIYEEALSAKAEEAKAEAAVLDAAAPYEEAIARMESLRGILGARPLSEAELGSLAEDLKLCGRGGEYGSWSESYQTIAYWTEVEAKYLRFSADARTALETTFSRVISDSGAASSLLGIENGSVDMDSVCLDEYQVELLKAEALASYWDRELDKARQVYEYAVAASSERPTAAVTGADYRSALDAYELARAAYAARLEELETAGFELGSAKEIVAAKGRALAEAKASLEAAEEKYDTLTSLLLSNDNVDFFKKELASSYRSLLEAESSEIGKEGSLATTMAAYLAAAREYGYEGVIELDNSLLKDLVSGSSEAGQESPSLESLRAQVDAAIIPTRGEDIRSFAIDSSTSLHRAYDQAAADYEAAIAAGSSLDAAFYLESCASIAAQYRASLQSSLDEREEAILILVSSSPEAWCEAQAGISASGIGEIASALDRAAKESGGDFLASRAELESKAYRAIGSADKLGDAKVYDFDLPGDFLAYQARGKILHGAEKAAALEALASFLRAGRLDLEASRGALYDFIASAEGGAEVKEFLRLFAGGKTEFFSIAGKGEGAAYVDHTAAFLLDAQRSRERALRLPGLLERYAPSSVAFVESLEVEGRAELAQALEGLGLGSGLALGAGSLASPAAAWALVSTKTPADRESYLASLLASARKAEAKLSKVQAESLEAYLSDLQRAFAARALAEGLAEGGSSLAAKGSLDRLDSELVALAKLRRESLSASDGRFKGLARLCAWAAGLVASGELGDEGAMAQDLAAARQCLVEAGAQKTLMRILADSAAGESAEAFLKEDSNWESAFDSVLGGALGDSPAFAASIADAAIARAKELRGIDLVLQGAKAVKSEEEAKALAYAVWKEPSLIVDSSALAISLSRGILLESWKFLQAEGGLKGSYKGSPAELDRVNAFLLSEGILTEVEDEDGKVVGYETAPGREEDASLIIGLLERIKAGLETKETVFLAALCPGLSDAVAAASAYDGSGGEVYERALAIDLASKLSGPEARPCFDLLLELSGLEAHGSIEDAWLGEAQADSFGLALSSLSGTGFDDSARLFYLKRRAHEGQLTEADEEASRAAAARLGLSPASHAELEDFEAELLDSRLFVRGLGEDELAFASRLEGLSTWDILRRAAAAAGGSSDDPYYSADLGFGGESSAYLGCLGSALVGEDSLVSGGLANEALKLLGLRLDERILELEAGREKAAAVYEIRSAAESIRSSGEADYRGYLTQKYFRGEDDKDPLPPSVETGDAKVIETEDALISASNRLISSLAPQGKDERESRSSLYGEYCAAMSKFVGASPISSWESSDSWSVDVETKAIYHDAATALARAESRAARLKNDIARIGKGLEAYFQGAQEREKTQADYRSAVEAAKAVYEGASDGLLKASDRFEKSMLAYDAVYDEAQARYSGAEEARHRLDITQAINEYAENAYLGLDAASSSAYRNPIEALGAARAKSGEAHVIVAALEGLYDESATLRESDTPKIIDYRDSYRAYIELERLQSQLDRAITAQEEAVRQAKGAYREAWNKEYGASDMKSAFAAAYSGKDLASASTADGDRLRWTDFVALSGTGLRLNYAEGSFALAQESSSDYAALAAYFAAASDEEAGAGAIAGYAKASAEFSAYIASCGDYGALMERWSLAYGYLQGKLNSANCVSGAAAESKSALQRFLEKGGFSSSDATRYLAAGGLRDWASLDPVVRDAIGDYGSWIDGICAASYQEIAADPKQKAMFDFFVASKLLGESRTTAMLDKKASLALYQELQSRIQAKQKEYKNTKESTNIAAAICFGLAAALWWAPPAMAIMAAQATAMGIISWDAGEKEAKCSSGAAELSRLLGETGYGGLYSTECSTLSTNAKNAASAYECWSGAEARLAALTGARKDGQSLTAREAIEALGKAVSALTQGAKPALSADEKGIIEKAYATGKVRETDSLGFLRACAKQAALARDSAEADLDGAVTERRSALKKAVDRYRDAAAGYMEGDGGIGIADLREAALGAFGSGGGASSPFAEIDYRSDLAEAFFSLSEGAPGTDRNYEAAKAQALGSYAESLAELYSFRLESLRREREGEWALRREELAAKAASWRAMAEATGEKSLEAWVSAGKKLESGYAAWKKSFEDEYEDKGELWTASYLSFAKRKEAWVEDLARKAAAAGSEEILAQAGLGAELLSRDPALVAGMSSAGRDPESMLDALLGDSRIEESLAEIRRRNQSVSAIGVELRRGLKADGSAAGSAMALVRKFQASEDEELGERAMLIVADKARQSIAKATKGYVDMVADANASVEESMDEMYLGNSFEKAGGSYSREAIVSATSNGPLKEKQSVETYRKFATPDFSIKTSLSDAVLKGLGSEGISALVDSALKELDAKRQEIFGKEGEEEKQIAIKVNSPDGGGARDETAFEMVDDSYTTWETYTDGDGETHTEEVTHSRKKKVLVARTETQGLGVGEFGKHVGYAPVFQRNPIADELGKPEDMVVAAGSGEAGRLVMYFSYFQVKESRGIAEYSKPSWDRKLWDDRGQWMKAPTPKQATDIIVSVVATACCNPWVALAVNLADDASFGMMEVSGGYRKADQAAFDFGKKALASIATTAIGSAAGLVSKGIADAGMGAAIARTTLKGSQLIGSSFAQAAVNNVTYGGEGLFGFDSYGFGESVAGEAALTSYASGLSSGFVGESLDSALYGFVGSMYADGRTLNALAGSLAGQGIGYAMTGEAVLNVAAMNGIGLMEMRLGGKDGFSMNLGSGGADLSIGTLVGAAGGLKAWGENLRLLASSQDEASRYAVAMRTLASTGRLKDRELYEDILSGKAEIVDNADGDYSAQTKMEDGVRMVSLGNRKDIFTSDLSLGVLLSHEAYRNGLDDGDEGQAAETLEAIQGHIGAAAMLEAAYGTGALGGRMSAELAAIRSGDQAKIADAFSAYDASGEYWRLTKDGNIAYDGLATLRDENGNVIHSAASMGLKETQLEGSLLKILGIDPKDKAKVEAVRRLMADSGIQHSSGANSDQWIWRGEQRVVVGYDGKTMKPITSTLNLSDSNLGKIITLAAINSMYSSIGASSKTLGGFIDYSYGSAIGMLNYTKNSSSAGDLLSRVYTPSQITTIHENQRWYNETLANGIDVDSMITGNAKRTTEFGVDTGDLKLASSSIEGAAFFQEIHPGIDYGSGGTGVRTPGGYWEFDDRQEHKSFFKLVGGDLKMRIMHIDPKDLQKLTLGAVYGNGSNSTKLFPYPMESIGSGTGAHVHIDFTTNLPYDGVYTRQFVDPLKLKPGTILNYSYSYKDSAHLGLPNYSKYFNRY